MYIHTYICIYACMHYLLKQSLGTGAYAGSEYLGVNRPVPHAWV